MAGFCISQQDYGPFKTKALHITYYSLFLAIILLSKNIYSFGMNCFPRDLQHHDFGQTEKGRVLLANLITALRIGFH